MVDYRNILVEKLEYDNFTLYVHCMVFYNKDKDELFDYKAVYLPNGDWKEHMLSNYLV